jgi:hypothetical protein
MTIEVAYNALKKQTATSAPSASKLWGTGKYAAQKRHRDPDTHTMAESCLAWLDESSKKKLGLPTESTNALAPLSSRFPLTYDTLYGFETTALYRYGRISLKRHSKLYGRHLMHLKALHQR